jgi:hypothetical protein
MGSNGGVRREDTREEEDVRKRTEERGRLHRRQKEQDKPHRKANKTEQAIPADYQVRRLLRSRM